MPTPYRWTGTLHREGEGIAATLRDPFGFTINLTGTRIAEGYALIGTPGPDPEWAALPGDQEPAPIPRDTTPDKPIKAPKPGVSKLLGEVCPDCMVPHGPPACGHDSRKICGGCGEPVGLLTKFMSGKLCVNCERARGNET